MPARRITISRMVLGEPVIDYLTKALQGGQAKNAKILWHGAFPYDFPFKEHNGIFQACAIT